jgi:hypothetical protein
VVRHAALVEFAPEASAEATAAIPRRLADFAARNAHLANPRRQAAGALVVVILAACAAVPVLASRDYIRALEPAIEIDIGAAARAEGRVFLDARTTA